ncbi:hypothetical protein FA15DRAFT_670619 [Coprinopsis marcescibilis]|uniref:Uncharacterized protein n=1 Tax=Coprinopsis marcescibilis TaxID=230819 RepID=A0A5C3KSP6_COPMA|nr:hypothetical protein FA15DRAFT_670619 [Coprinopsis marcescibilis]
MEYLPRYQQPFTLQEAVRLDVSVIAEEIARLQHSLSKLRETQELLKAHLEQVDPSDPDILLAFEDNNGVIGSQQERIGILRMALRGKGVCMDEGNHYNAEDSITASQEAPQTSGVDELSNNNDEVNTGHGVYL